EPRGATGTVGTPPANTPGSVGTMPWVGTANALRSAGTNGSAMPPDVAAVDGPAVVSGTLPRGATGADCGGLSKPGRMLAANCWLASGGSSAELRAKSLSAST